MIRPVRLKRFVNLILPPVAFVGEDDREEVEPVLVGSEGPPCEVVCEVLGGVG